MSNFQILNSIDHKDLRVIDQPGAEYGDAIHCCPAYTFEFRALQADFPVLFTDTTTDGLLPVALMGFEPGENLLLDGASWRASSRPAFLRKGPFLIGQHTTDEAEDVRLLSIDMEHARVSTHDEGEPLFQPLGGRTEYLESIADLLEHIYYAAEETKQFVAALKALDLIESVTLDISLRDGSQNQLLGFSTVNEEAVKTLSPSALGELSKAGQLMPLFMMLASLGNLRKLIDLKEAARVAP